uniref:Uncharacterized protein n=1 Tax=Caenorhabditis tropicalis TaxID=1561998 RepID=A0A1I7TJ70_9PELO
MHDNLKKYIRELKLMYKKSDHIHFLHEILFVKNLRSYPLPRRWIALIAIHGNSVFLERILAAIRVVTDYDGDSAPEFNFDLF